eukprot:CAMPEP_0201534094 /NCGR_PEP_ID=MMETSP0161_2-20130828/55278_1 /ASSEMBLY_ACC=CAM_ASM_000251 /TAXON_ID=180227 /ORGANISM="Neoparamoeba aestuarina, Strain SoJaBio B1-5/56/2" /LENGTH=211 /DNA_ID=CAMNT_0047938551 /DNA_START=101 /DNA_END=736 /DNA_ORIENTATION=-
MEMEFYEYENEFQRASKDVVQLVNGLPRLQGMDRKQTIGNVNQILRDMDDLIGRMEDVVREEGNRGMLEANLRRRAQDLQRLRRDFERKQNEAPNMTNQQRFEQRTTDQRDQLLDGVNRLDKGSEKLNNTYAMSLENEELAADTLGTLYQQRETLEGANKKVSEMNDDITVADEHVGSIWKRAVSDKAILIVANVLLFMLNIFMVYFLISG